LIKEAEIKAFSIHLSTYLLYFMFKPSAVGLTTIIPFKLDYVVL